MARRKRPPARWRRSDGAFYKTPDDIWTRIRFLAGRVEILSFGNRGQEALEQASREILYFSELMGRRGKYRYVELSGESIRVLKIALTGRFTRLAHLHRILWPEEFALVTQSHDTLLNSRFYRIRLRALIEIERVLADPDLEATLTKSGRDFYNWLREQFGPHPFAQVRRHLNQIGGGPEKTKRRGDDFVLGISRLQVMEALLFASYETELDACRDLWPQDFGTKNPQSLISRFSHNKYRGLEVVVRILAQETFYSLGLPAVEVRFYERVVAEFGPDETIRKVVERVEGNWKTTLTAAGS